MGLFDWLKGGKTLYFPSEFTIKKTPEIYQNYLEILNILEVDFILISELEDSGMSFIHEGDQKNARTRAMENYEIFKKNRVSKIITNSPEVYRMLKEFYPKFIRDFDIKIEHISITILNALNKKGIRFKDSENKKEILTFQDSCYIGRHFGIYEEPRLVIENLGGKIIEFEKNRENAICSGACGGVYINFPEIARRAAGRRIKQIPMGVSKIITPSEISYLNLKNVNENVYELSSFVLNKLKELGNSSDDRK